MTMKIWVSSPTKNPTRPKQHHANAGPGCLERYSFDQIFSLPDEEEDDRWNQKAMAVLFGSKPVFHDGDQPVVKEKPEDNSHQQQ